MCYVNYANIHAESASPPQLSLKMATESKVIVTCLYPKKEMLSFNMECYLKHHIPTTETNRGPLCMTGCIICETIEDPEYTVNVVMTWKDLSSWETAKKGKAAEQLAADVANFTNVSGVMVVEKVLN